MESEKRIQKLKTNRTQILIDLIFEEDDTKKFILDKFFRSLVIYKDKINLAKPIIKLEFSLPFDIAYEMQKTNKFKLYTRVYSTRNTESIMIVNPTTDKHLTKTFETFLIPFNTVPT